MNPKEKAIELVDKYHKIHAINNYEVKQCALIAVDEILDATTGMVDEDNNYSSDNYWNEVKQEINDL